MGVTMRRSVSLRQRYCKLSVLTWPCLSMCVHMRTLITRLHVHNLLRRVSLLRALMAHHRSRSWTGVAIRVWWPRSGTALVGKGMCGVG